MLDNTELIHTLEETKSKASEVFEKLRLAEKTFMDIDKLREAYRPAAKRGAVLFFVLTEMALVNSMYQYSLASYLEWYDLDGPEQSPFPMKYKENLSDFRSCCCSAASAVDRVYRAMTDYVTNTMGEKYVQPPMINCDAIHEQSTPSSPIVFILSPGSDPTSDLMN
ncbi:Dynein heavy chain 10 [Nibea albiflora]|nr:Dynein heavy chain 10 [Nibea albiflora]